MTLVAERMISACAPGDDVEQLLGRQAELHVDLVAGGAQAVEAAVGDLFGDEDASHGGPSLSSRSRRSEPVTSPLMGVVVVGAGISGLLCAQPAPSSTASTCRCSSSRRGSRVAASRPSASVERCSTPARSSSPSARPGSKPWSTRGSLRGVVREWCRGFPPAPDGFPRYIGVEGMAAIAEAAAEGLDVRLDVDRGATSTRSMPKP